MSLKKLLTGSVFCLLTVTLGYGQEGRLKTNVSFPFAVGKKVLPAGEYLIVHEKDSTPYVTILDADGKVVAKASVLTFLEVDLKSQQPAKLVFDRSGDTPILAEVWIKDQSGVVVHAAKKNQQREVVEAAE
jgi:hypothetical protein